MKPRKTRKDLPLTRRSAARRRAPGGDRARRPPLRVKDLRAIRTMRDVWSKPLAPSREAKRPGVDTRRVRPWVFRGQSANAGGKLAARVVEVVEPRALVRAATGQEFVVLYRLTDVLRESIRVELHGDILVLSARGCDPRRRGIKSFQVLSEAHVRGVRADSQVRFTYSESILEVHITPPEGAVAGTGGAS